MILPTRTELEQDILPSLLCKSTLQKLMRIIMRQGIYARLKLTAVKSRDEVGCVISNTRGCPFDRRWERYSNNKVEVTIKQCVDSIDKEDIKLYGKPTIVTRVIQPFQSMDTHDCDIYLEIEVFEEGSEEVVDDAIVWYPNHTYLPQMQQYGARETPTSHNIYNLIFKR